MTTHIHIAAVILLFTVVSFLCIFKFCTESNHQIPDQHSNANSNPNLNDKIKQKISSTKKRHKANRKKSKSIWKPPKIQTLKFKQHQPPKLQKMSKSVSFPALPISPQIDRFPSLNSNFDSFKEIADKYSIPCSTKSSIKSCKAIKRIIYALKYYESLDIIKKNNKLNISKLIQFIDSRYKSKHLLDDFIHIKTKHNNKLEQVQSLIIKELKIKKCDINHCISLSRHNRDRNLDRNHEESKDDENWIFIRDTFDNIHSYLFHTFDMGLRIKQKELESIKNKYEVFKKKKKNLNEDESKYDDINENECIDKYFKNIIHILRKNNKKLKAFGRFKTNKYNIDNNKIAAITDCDKGITWIEGLFEFIEEKGIGYKERVKLQAFLHEEEYDTDSIIFDAEDLMGEIYMNRTQTSNMISYLNNDKRKLQLINEYGDDSTLYESSFSTGYIFYYWPYYKNKIRIRHKYDDTNHVPKELYISQKYESLQDEVLNNTIYGIKYYQFADILKKAEHFMDSQRVKSMISCSDYVHFGIKQYSSLTIENLICVILYCDWSDLCTAFSSTFRRKRSFEPISSIKRRNREYWHLSKILRETVELYGEHKGYYNELKGKWTGVAGPFYCGMSFVCVIPQFNMRLYGPTSTSKQIEVATRFGGDHGIIIELNNNGDWNSEYLRCFDCSWISNYNGEEERLFFGGRYRMKVEGVRNIETRQDFSIFFHSLFYFDCMLNGVDMQKDTNDEICKKDEQILEKLIRHKLRIKDNTFDPYVNKTFDSFCNQKREITLNLHDIGIHFDKLRYLIFKKNKSNLFNDILFKLFKNLNIIKLQTTNRIPYKQYSFSLLALAYLLDSTYCNDNIRVIVIADWPISNTYNICDRSWICNELQHRTSFNPNNYVIQLKTTTIQNRFPQDSLTIYKA